MEGTRISRAIPAAEGWDCRRLRGSILVTERASMSKKLVRVAKPHPPASLSPLPIKGRES
jgi:hypothetical protein